MGEMSRRTWMAGAAAGAASLGGALAATKAGSAPDSLNGIAQTKGLAFGCCLGTGLRKSSDIGSLAQFKEKPSSHDDPQLRALFAKECGILVHENELKWYVVRQEPDKFDFERADLLMAYAKQHQMAVRGHTLLWNRSVWMPDWINKFDFGANPAAKAEAMLNEHIATVCKRYGERIFSYDVVNETIDPKTGEFEPSPFTKVLGPKVIDIAFHAARAAAPKAELVYNDYMGWAPKDATHRAAVLKLLERMKKDNVPVDALGIQAHIGSNGMGAATSLIGDADEKAWRKFLDDVTGMGLALVFTEFDVNDKYVNGSIAERDRVVADYAKAYLDIALSYRETRYVMAWGLADKYSWLQNTSPRPDGLPKRPTPYDENFQPKPLREAIAKAFAAAPARTLYPMTTA